MARQLMTPEQKEAARVQRTLLKAAEKLAQQEKVAQEQAEWESNKHVLFLEMFVKVAHMIDTLTTRRDKDWDFYKSGAGIDVSYELLDDGTSVLTASAYGYDCCLKQNKFSQYEYQQFESEMTHIAARLEEYDEKQERERIEAEQRENTRKTALSKLTEDEKKVLGIR